MIPRDELTGTFNYADLIREFDEAKDLEPNGIYAPKHFFRAGIIGPSGCGKTYTLLSLILGDDPELEVKYDKIYVYAKDIHEPAYEFLKKILDKVEEQLRQNTKKPPGWKLYVFGDDLNDVPKVTDMDKKMTTLMIFDDWATDSEKSQNIISQHYKMGRKQHCSYFYLSQSYFDIPSFIRKQFTHLYVFRLRTARDVQNLLKEHNPGYEPGEFQKMYDAATKPKHCFLQINKTDFENPVRQGFKNAPKFT